MVTNLKGIQLFLKMGQPKSKPKLVPYEIMTALNTVEVNDDVHEQQDGFQMTFTLGKHQVKDYTLLGSGLFNIDTKVVIGVLLNATPYVLISGVITQFQLQASNQPGMSTLSIDGQSITHRLRRTELNDKHERLSDTQIVEKLIGRYAGDGLTVDAPKTTEQPLDTYLIPRQAATDMEYIQELA